MDALLASLDYWYRLLVAYSIVMGIEAPLLFLIASLRRRPWREQALALLPVGGFAFGMYQARLAHNTLVYWQSYVAFWHADYSPDYWAHFENDALPAMQTLVTSVQHQAWGIIALTCVLLLGGWALLVYWLPSLRRAPERAPKPSETNASADPPEDDEAGNLEITIEPLE